MNKERTESQRRFLQAPITSIQVRMEDEESTSQRIEGYAALFNEPTEIWGYVEQIAPGAFAEVMQDDVRALFNHDMNFPLARSVDGSGTLELRVDEKGLYFSFEVGSQSYAQDLYESIQRGDVTQASFGFWIGEETWEKKDEVWHSTITKIDRLLDVSPVTYPAYKQTEIQARSAERVPNKQANNPDGYSERSQLSLEIDILKLKAQ